MRSVPCASLLLLALAPRSTDAQTRLAALVYDIKPVGGPVFGDTIITLRGVGLDFVSCQFQLPGDNPPARQTAPCVFNPQDVPLGSSCKCTTPRAPQYTTTMQVFDPLTNQNRPTQVPTSDLLHGPVVVTAEGSWGRSFSPFAVTFTYYELNRAINVTSIEPTAGSFYVDTLVTVRGNGFVDYSGGGGVYCSFPGPYWDPFMLATNPEYPYQDFTSPATIVSTTEIHCVVPPKGNNSDPSQCAIECGPSATVRGRVRPSAAECGLDS